MPAWKDLAVLAVCTPIVGALAQCLVDPASEGPSQACRRVDTRGEPPEQAFDRLFVEATDATPLVEQQSAGKAVKIKRLVGVRLDTPSSGGRSAAELERSLACSVARARAAGDLDATSHYRGVQARVTSEESGLRVVLRAPDPDDVTWLLARARRERAASSP